MKKIIVTLSAVFLVLLGFSQNNANYIDFEPGTYSASGTAQSHIPVETDPIDNPYFKSNYGVEFRHSAPGNSIVTPIYAEVGAPVIAFLNASTLYTGACAISGYVTDDYPYASTLSPGCFFLTDDVPGVSTVPKDLYIIYDQNFPGGAPSIASGYIYDIDGNEAWKITAYEVSTSGTYVPMTPVYLYASSFGDATSAYWQVSTINNPIGYIKMEWVGPQNISVGVAFDNFYYNSGINPSPCAVTAEFSYSTLGCGVQFTDLSSSGSNTSIIGYQWTFTDMNTGNVVATSTEQNPFHQFLPGLNILAKLIVTAYNGEKCCQSEYEREIGEIKDCFSCDKAIVSFKWKADKCDPCLMYLDAIVNNISTQIVGYYWEIKDLNTGVVIATYTGPSIQAVVTNSNLVCLTVIFMGANGQFDCCNQTICAEVTCGKDGVSNSTGKSMKSEGEETGALINYGIEQKLESMEIKKVYPNPTNAVLNIEVNSEIGDIVNIDLISTNGQVINFKTNIALEKGDNLIQLETAKIPSGLYVVRIQGKLSSINEKVTIKH